MGRPKKQVVESPGEEATKQTKVTEVKIEKTEPKKMPLEEKGTFLVIVSGVSRYYTKGQLDVMFQRNSHSLEIPKGSAYVAPKNHKCTSCG